MCISFGIIKKVKHYPALLKLDSVKYEEQEGRFIRPSCIFDEKVSF